MCIWSYYLLEEDVDFISQLEKDYRCQIKFPYVFCLAQDRLELEKKFDIRFVDGTDALFDLLMGDNNILDLDLMFRDDIRLFNPSPLLFYNDFDGFFDEIEKLLKSNIEYLVKNYDECKKNYIEMLVELARE